MADSQAGFDDLDAALAPLPSHVSAWAAASAPPEDAAASAGTTAMDTPAAEVLAAGAAAAAPAPPPPAGSGTLRYLLEVYVAKTKGDRDPLYSISACASIHVLTHL
jgi:hypothetical protein